MNTPTCGSKRILVDDLDRGIAEYRQNGYRLEMIKPADSPREALLLMPTEEGDHQATRLVLSSNKIRRAETQGRAWVTGRAGMEYRDLTLDRYAGSLIASHIRLTKGGDVPDYVHYHKIDFQMIYCKRGRIRVVYEDQGPPFWLENGDCVLQPPEIRHRVIECTAGAEVIEVSAPAEHETWVEHEIKLPTKTLRPDRQFGGQRFIRHVAYEAAWRAAEYEGYESRDLSIGEATNGVADAEVIRPLLGYDLPPMIENGLLFPLEDGKFLVVSVSL